MVHRPGSPASLAADKPAENAMVLIKRVREDGHVLEASLVATMFLVAPSHPLQFLAFRGLVGVVGASI